MPVRIQRLAATFIGVVLILTVSGKISAGVNCSGGLVCTQTIQLSPGWNAIHIKLQPTDDAVEQVFADFLDGSGPTISSLWTWLPRRAKVDFIQDPNTEEMLSSPGWLRFFPASASESFLNNLYAVLPNRAYLVKLEGAVEETLTVTGLPVVPSIDWQPGEFNLTGLPVDPANPPVFEDFFSSSPAHQGQAVYQLVNNAWQAVNLATTAIDSDKAYWIFSKSGSQFLGPLSLKLPQVDRVEFGNIVEQTTLRFDNKTQGGLTAAVEVLGNNPGLFYENPDAAAAEDWLPLSSSLPLTLAATEELRLPLGIRRSDFTPADFGQILEVTSSAGSRWLIPVTASAPQLNSLWVGTVTIDQVSQVHNYLSTCTAEPTEIVVISPYGNDAVVDETETIVIGSNPGSGTDLCTDANGFPISEGNVLGSVGGEFSFRVIMHREQGLVRLLKDVILMESAEGTPVLLTNENLIPNYAGTMLRDGELVGRRLSTVAYDFAGETLAMNGGLEGVLTAQIDLAADAPTNPFSHYYHAAHGDEGYAVTRTMEFTFTSPTGELGSGYDLKGGTYREVISGLHKSQIVAAGTFTLRHAAQVDTLNQ